jgi:beta-lactamase superfamily II metal-dependent hydrolase
VAVLLILLAVAALLFWQFALPRITEWRRQQPPPASGEELKIVVLDVGQGDSILVVAPSGKTALVDAGNPGMGKRVLEAMSRHNVDHLDLFITTHGHADHIGAADEVINGTTVHRVLDSKVPHTTKNYEEFIGAVERKIENPRENFITATPGQKFDLGGGVVITVLAPVQPFFTADQLRSGGNEPNANSVVARLDYGDFSMLLTGDAEAQTEQRMMNEGANISTKVLKVGHHGSRYASSEEFLKRGAFEVAIISNGPDNRYGHPSQEALDRFRAANIKIYRTDLQGEITITTKGEERDYKVKAARETKEDMWAGREPLRDDSARRGFIDFGDLPPAPKPKREAANTNRANTNRANTNRRATTGR